MPGSWLHSSRMGEYMWAVWSILGLIALISLPFIGAWIQPKITETYPEDCEDQDA